MKVGFIDLGKMGHPMAGNILMAGYELTVQDVRREAGPISKQRGPVGSIRHMR